MKYILCFFLLGLGISSYAQDVTITDRQTGDPLPLVTLNSQQAQATTNMQGQVDLTPFKDAKSIEIRMMGYETLFLSYRQLQKMGFKLRLASSNISLNELVVSATRWKQSSDDIPAKVVGISTEDAILQNPQTAADLLGISGKVFIQKSQQGGGSPMIRGFATNRLLYTIDGVRMNTAIFRGGNVQNVISLDPFAMESTEVLFGPGSVIYGSDAIGGVMSFQTLNPTFSDSGKLSVKGNALTRYSTANQEKTGHLDIGIGGDQWAMATSFTHWDYDHLRQGSNGPVDYLKSYYITQEGESDRIVNQVDPLLQVPSAYAQTNFMQKVRYAPNRHWDIQYAFHYSATSPYGRYDRHNRVRNGNPRYGQWDYGPQKWRMHYLSATHAATAGVYDEMALRLASQAFGESRISRNFNNTERSIREEQVQAYSVNLDLLKYIGEKNTLFYGAEFIQNDVQSSGSSTNILTGAVQAGPSRYPQASWNSLAVYASHEWKASERLTVQGGLRYNYLWLDAGFDTSFYPLPFESASLHNGAVTGSLGAVFRPANDWVLNANIGTAFRSPNVDDIGKVFDSEPGALVVPNLGLKPEYAYNLDVGATKVFGEALKLDVTGYYTLLQNALVRRDFQLNGLDSIVYDGVLSQVQAIQNAATARVYGIQFGMELQLINGLRLSSDINYQKGREELDNGEVSPSRHAAPWFGVTRLRYKCNKLQVELYAQYQGEQSHENLAWDERGKDEIYAKDQAGNTYAPAWYTVNLKGSYRLNEHLSFNMGIENLTDQRYRPYSSGISGAGRNLVISARASL